MNEFRMRKANFPFGRVDIDIDCLGIEMHKQDKLRMFAFWKKRSVGLIYRMGNCGIFDGATIDENFLGRSGRSCMVRAYGKPRELKRTGLMGDREKAFKELWPVELQ